MSKWKVFGGNDAWAVKFAVVEADSADEARQLAIDNSSNFEWKSTGEVSEFDHFEVFTEQGSVVPFEQLTALYVATGEDGDPSPEDVKVISDRQLATILAALRHYQAHMASITEPIANIATNEGEFDALTEMEVDNLIEELNS